MTIPQLIKRKRLELKENQTDFGKRFGVTHASVSEWESGKSEASYMVIEFILDIKFEKFSTCHMCNGTGIVKVKTN